MQSIILVSLTILAVSQLCIGAVIPKTEGNSNSLEGISDAAIDLLGATFLMLPTADKEKVGILINVLKRVNKNLTAEEQVDCGTELVYLAISNKNSTLTLAKWKKVINESIQEQETNNGTLSSSTDEKSLSSSSEGFTQEDSKLIEEKLSGIVAAEEVKRIINTLNGFRNVTTSAESNAAMYDLFVSAIGNTLGMQPYQVKDMFNYIQINETSYESSDEKI